MKKIRTLAEAKKDNRVYAITRIEGWNGLEYEINLNDGYVFDDGSHVQYAFTVSELCDIINNEIEEEMEN